MARRDPLYKVGSDPDPRFTLANERTFLAWTRTALALVAGGLAASEILPNFDVPGGNHILGIPLIAGGAALAYASYYRWDANERALRHGDGITPTRMPRWLAWAVFASAALALLLLAFGGE